MQNMEGQWRLLSEEVISGMKEWRDQHPKATLREIEEAIDERLHRLRARMLQDAALASSQADWSEAEPEQRPTVESHWLHEGRNSGNCKHRQGKKSRYIAVMGCARPVRSGFSPLDEQLGLVPGTLTPRSQDHLTH